jgi:hypothetical protein
MQRSIRGGLARKNLALQRRSASLIANTFHRHASNIHMQYGVVFASKQVLLREKEQQTLEITDLKQELAIEKRKKQGLANKAAQLKQLKGVRVLVQKELMERKRMSDLEQEVVLLKTRYQDLKDWKIKKKQEHERVVRLMKSQHAWYLATFHQPTVDVRSGLMKSGMTVDYRDRPPVGTRVKENLIDGLSFCSRSERSARRGAILFNDMDNGTEIGVHWDNGTESHNLWCNKKKGHALLYE